MKSFKIFNKNAGYTRRRFSGGQATIEYFVLFAIFATITMLSINFLGKFADPLKNLDDAAKRVISNREYLGARPTYIDRRYYESDWEARDYE